VTDGRQHSAAGALPQLAAPAEDGVALGVEVAVTTPRQRTALARAGLLVGPATLLANVLGYAFNVVVSRALGPDGYGALGALLGLVLIGAVPALALQAVAARRTAAATCEELPGLVARLLRTTLLLGAATTAVLAAVCVPVSGYLRLDGLSAALWLAVSLAPLVAVSGAQGVLQGRERFGPLAVLFVVAAGLRLAGGTVAVAVGGAQTAVLAGTAVGSTVAALVGLVLVRGLVPAGTVAAADPGLPRELLRAGGGLLALVTVANVDVLLARHHLPAREAGLYAAGAVFAKGAFWAPQVVVVLALPRLGGAQGQRVLRASLLAVTGCGALLVAGTALLARPLVAVVFGERYAALADTAWAFTALGAALAVAQLLVFSGIATQSIRLALLVAATAAAEAALITVALHDSVGQVVGAALGSALVLVAAGAVVTRGRSPDTLPSGRP
jgi:O-antigen/teichoic acid export membrane protein